VLPSQDAFVRRLLATGRLHRGRTLRLGRRTTRRLDLGDVAGADRTARPCGVDRLVDQLVAEMLSDPVEDRAARRDDRSRRRAGLLRSKHTPTRRRPLRLPRARRR
jgi:hypothetical protein